MGLERDYQIRNPSKVLYKKGLRYYSTSNLKPEIVLNP